VQQITALMDELQKQVDLMAGLFSVRVSQQDSFREILARAHQQMSAVAVELLPQMLGEGGAISTACQEGLHDAVDDYARRFVQLSAAVSNQAGRDNAQGGPVRLSARVPATPVPATPAAASDPGLRGKIQSAIALCRIRQRELSLVLLEVDDYASHLLAMGPERMTRVVYATRRAVQELADTPHECLVISDTRCAILLVDCDRRQAIELARLLLDAVPPWLVRHGSTDSIVSFSAGIASLATPTHASRPDDLIEAADRCLFAAQRSGGGITKSIDVL
jgi:GGDEF domain-containing protein